MPPLPTLHQSMIRQMLRLVELFASRVADRSTLDELFGMIGDEKSWCKAHDFFDRVRRKSLTADRSDLRFISQCNFEEACAKTLFNMTDTRVPFDEDAPYWVVPQALRLARRLGIDETEITRIVAP
jgi:hypothetical protein